MIIAFADVGAFALAIVVIALSVLVIRLPHARQALGISRLTALLARMLWRSFGRDRRREER